MGQIEDHNQSQKAADDILRCGWHSAIFLWSMASIYHIIGYIWLFPHNIPDLPHYILHYNISQLVNWAVNYEWTMGCLLWPTVWPIPRVNTIKPNSLWEKSSTFVSLIKDNDILSSNMPLAISLYRCQTKAPMNCFHATVSCSLTCFHSYSSRGQSLTG